MAANSDSMPMETRTYNRYRNIGRKRHGTRDKDDKKNDFALEVR